MRRKALARACALAVLGCVPGRVIDGNGDMTLEARAVPEFTGVRNLSSLPLRVTEAANTVVSVKIDSNLRGALVTHVDQGMLVVEVVPVGDATGIAPSPSSEVAVTLPVLERAEALSSGPLAITGLTGSDDLALVSAGSGSIGFRGAVGTLTLDLSGSGLVSLKGNAVVLKTLVTGSGTASAIDLVAQSAELKTESSGSILAQLAGGPARFEVTSSGNIDWWGAASQIEEVDTSTGTITHHL